MSAPDLVGFDPGAPDSNSTAMCIMAMRDGALRCIEPLFDRFKADLLRASLWRWVPVSFYGRKRVRLPPAAGPMRARRRRSHAKQWNAPRHLPRIVPAPPLRPGQALYGSPDIADAMAYAFKAVRLRGPDALADVLGSRDV